MTNSNKQLYKNNYHIIPITLFVEKTLFEAISVEDKCNYKINE